MVLLERLIDDAGQIVFESVRLRALPLAAPWRRERVALTFRACRRDSTFADAMRQGDANRDARTWDQGVKHYSEGLQLYPYHHGCMLQRSHCLKESENFAEAELGYRDALALGAAFGDVWEHLAFVSARAGWRDRLYPTDLIEALESGAANLRDELVLSDEIRELAQLLFGAAPPGAEWALEQARAAPCLEQLVERLVQDPRFTRANRRLLTHLLEEERLLD